jgi:hypothetical protein
MTVVVYPELVEGLKMTAIYKFLHSPGKQNHTYLTFYS